MTDTINTIIVICAGILASIPISIGLLWFLTREREPRYEPSATQTPNDEEWVTEEWSVGYMQGYRAALRATDPLLDLPPLPQIGESLETRREA